MREPPYKNRLGSFLVSHSMLMLYPDQTRKLLARCLIIRAESDSSMDAIRYTAYCRDFDVVEQGIAAPEYRALIEKDDKDFVRLHFQKDPNGLLILTPNKSPLMGKRFRLKCCLVGVWRFLLGHKPDANVHDWLKDELSNAQEKEI